MSKWLLEAEISESVIDDSEISKEEIIQNEEDMIFTWDEFLTGVNSGFLTDYDGVAFPLGEDGIAQNIPILPSNALEIELTPAKIVWVNK